jgi:hypothetical protein
VNLLFQRRSDPVRNEFEELRKVLTRLKTSRPQVRRAVGNGVHLANTEFIRHFGGIESFRRISVEEQKHFAAELSDLELDLRGQEPVAAMGVGLYRIWFADMLAGRRNVAEVLGEELTELSRKASGA